MAGFGVKPAGLLDARPQFPNGAEFGDGEKFVGVGGKPEIDHAARGFERHAAGFERAQAIDRGGEREGQLLRFRAAGIVDDAPVGDRERPAKALLGELANDCRRKLSTTRSTASGWRRWRQSRRSG